jgi:aminomethyltransferase
MVKYGIAGADATRYLDRLMTRNIAKLRPGRVAYAVWCDDAGLMIDDGTVFRLAEQEYRLCTGERQLDWLLDSSIGFDVTITEITADIAALALQGPCSCWVLKSLGLEGIDTLAPFEHRTFMLPDDTTGGAGTAAAPTMMVSRTGFTGDLGYELWVDPADAERLWDALIEAGRVRTIRPVGSRALNIARLEAGFLLPNVDFVSSAHTLRNGTARSPLELGLGWCVDFGKGHFTGRRALLADHGRGPRRRLVGLDVADTKPAHNALLYADRTGRREIGSVTSAAWSPTCKRNIALAMLDAPHFDVGREVWAEIYLNRELTWERRMVRAHVVERPFFAPARRRAMPPGDF